MIRALLLICPGPAQHDPAVEPDPARFGDDALYAGGRNEGDHFSVAPAGSDDERDRSSRLCSEPDRFDIPEPPAGRFDAKPARVGQSSCQLVAQGRSSAMPAFIRPQQPLFLSS